MRYHQLNSVRFSLDLMLFSLVSAIHPRFKLYCRAISIFENQQYKYYVYRDSVVSTETDQESEWDQESISDQEQVMDTLHSLSYTDDGKSELGMKLSTDGCSYRSFKGRPTNVKRCLKVQVWVVSSDKEDTLAAEIEPEVFHGNSLKGEIDFIRPFTVDVKTASGNSYTIDCVQVLNK